MLLPVTDLSMNRFTTSEPYDLSHCVNVSWLTPRRVSVSLTTHSANSTITSLDLELAQACDKAEEEIIADRPPPKKKVQST